MTARPFETFSRDGGEPLDWERSLAQRLIVTDLVMIASAMAVTQWAWFMLREVELGARWDTGQMGMYYSVVSVVLALIWMLVLALYDTRSRRVIGSGTTEYKRLVDAALRLFGLVAIVAFLFDVELARGYILTAFPLGITGLVAGRMYWRGWLVRQRSKGRFSHRVLLAGSVQSVVHTARELGRTPSAGYRVVGACVPANDGVELLPATEIPVVGELDQIPLEMAALRADTLVVTSSDELGPQRIRHLSWSLQPGRQHLVVAPGLTDIAGPRIHTRPVAGLPLIHVETPRYEGRKWVTKRTFDLIGGAAVLLLLSPVLTVLAVLVKLTSDGPVFYRQERIGHLGRPFRMVKFRTMVVGADERLQALLEQQGTHATPLFKVRDDPRLTSVGAFLRRHSLDELPQLLNVLRGQMSLVGPRPQRQDEVALYDNAAYRRLIVQPGMTGLWQVSGRSNLAWEDAIRLDLYYVENWSFTGDIAILWRTFRAVIFPQDAAI